MAKLHKSRILDNMRTWLKVLDNLPSLKELIGHTCYSGGAFAHTCEFCKARGGKHVEAAYTVVYDCEMFDPPNNIQRAKLCLKCSKPAVETVGISK